MRVLCGGRSVMGVPTAIRARHQPFDANPFLEVLRFGRAAGLQTVCKLCSLMHRPAGWTPPGMFRPPEAPTANKMPPSLHHRMSAIGVRREKAALSSGCKPHPATAPAGSNRSSHGGNEVAEAFD